MGRLGSTGASLSGHPGDQRKHTPAEAAGRQRPLRLAMFDTGHGTLVSSRSRRPSSVAQSRSTWESVTAGIGSIHRQIVMGRAFLWMACLNAGVLTRTSRRAVLSGGRNGKGHSRLTCSAGFSRRHHWRAHRLTRDSSLSRSAYVDRCSSELQGGNGLSTPVGGYDTLTHPPYDL